MLNTPEAYKEAQEKPDGSVTAASSNLDLDVFSLKLLQGLSEQEWGATTLLPTLFS